MEHRNELWLRPESIKRCENRDDDHGVEREKVGSQGDEGIALGDNDVSALGRGLELLEFSAKAPGPNHMGQLVTHDIKPGGLWETEEDDQPAATAAEQGDPHLKRITGDSSDVLEGVGTSDTDREKQSADQEP
jgi:hypothetical protein